MKVVKKKKGRSGRDSKVLARGGGRFTKREKIDYK